jgi:hypothetical protein
MYVVMYVLWMMFTVHPLKKFKFTAATYDSLMTIATMAMMKQRKVWFFISRYLLSL